MHSDGKSCVLGGCRARASLWTGRCGGTTCPAWPSSTSATGPEPTPGRHAVCSPPTVVPCTPGLGGLLFLHTAAEGEELKALAGLRCVQVIEQMRAKLRLLCAPVQLPMGLEEEHKGLVDLIKMKAFTFEGPNGETIKRGGVLQRTCVCAPYWVH